MKRKPRYVLVICLVLALFELLLAVNLGCSTQSVSHTPSQTSAPATTWKSTLTPSSTPTPITTPAPIVTSTPRVGLQITFDWVYQPNGSGNFLTGTTSGTISIMAANQEDSSSAYFAGFNFSQGTIVPIGESDIYYADYLGYPNKLWANYGRGGIRDMGIVSLKSVLSTPEIPHDGDVYEYYHNQATDAKFGHTYCVVTADGVHYAKFRITYVQMPQFIH